MVKTQSKKDRDQRDRRVQGLQRRLLREAGFQGPFPAPPEVALRFQVPSIEELQD